MFNVLTTEGDAAAWQRRVRERLEEHLAKCVQDCQQAVGSEVTFGAEWGIRPALP